MNLPSDQEKELRAALKALCELARTNFPRSTDIAVEIDAGPTASARVKIPVWLLDRLLKEAAQ